MASEFDTAVGLSDLKELYPEAPNWACHIDTKISKTYIELSQFTSQIVQLEEKVSSQQDNIKTLTDDNTYLKNKVQFLEDYSRQNNLKIEGIPEGNETEHELAQKVHNLLKDKLNLDPQTIRVEKLHRLGKKYVNAKQPRLVMVRFLSYSDRNMVWNKRSQLKGTSVFLKEDFSAATEKERSQLYPYYQATRAKGAKCVMRGNKLIIESQTYTVDKIHFIPWEYTPAANCEKSSEKVVLFCGKDSVFSNFHECPFKEGPVTYQHNEMYIQSKKAELFGDEVTAQKILKEKNPGKCKKLGSRIQYDVERWRKCAADIAYKGALAKFSQNERLKESLLKTNGKILAEATRDRWWGTGKSISDPTGFEWDGENYMGQVLMQVRKVLAPKSS